MSTAKLGRNQKAILDVMHGSGGIWPYPVRHTDRQLLQSLQRRGIVHEVDGTWRLS